MSTTKNGKPTVPSFDAEACKRVLAEWDEEKKILIVGGGAAGLYAAYTLEYLGFRNYQILEAHSEIGGRLRQNSTFIDDLPLDDGAEWIHYSEPRILQDLILFEDDTVTVETIPYKPQTWGTYVKGKAYRRDWLKHLYGENKFKSTTWFSYFEEHIYGRIDKEKVLLNAVVESVDYSNDSAVKVTLKGGQMLEADHVIVTASVGILQAGAINFIPAMPKRWTKELNKIDFAAGFKAFFQFEDKFYPDIQNIGSLINAFIPTNEKSYFDAVLGKPTSVNVMGSLQMGKTSEERSKLNDEDLQKELLKELDAVFDGKASKHLVKSAIQNWSAEPYVRGTYSVSIFHKKSILREGVKGRVLFAGEYLGSPQVAVQGAALSGRKAVEDLLLSN